MRHLTLLAVVIMAGQLGGCGLKSSAAKHSFDFEKKSIPPGWEVGATHPSAATGVWVVEVEDGNRVLSLKDVAQVERRTYNLLWTNGIPFRDGTLTVRLRANEGVIDQGGGLIWRARDNDNYYIARYNPLETNLRVYHVKEGKRTQLQDAPDIVVPAGEWATLSVTHIGDHIVVALDGVEKLNVHDNTFTEAGAIGFWTKADAATSFDDLTVEAAD
jgi:hypothetical protein